MAGSVAMAWLCTRDSLIDAYESLLLLGGSVTFFWVGGLLDGYLLLQKSAAWGEGGMRLTRKVSMVLSMFSALMCGVIGHQVYGWISPGALTLYCLYLFLETSCQMLPYALVATGRVHGMWAYSVIYGLGYVLSLVVPLLLGLDLMGVLWALLFWAGIRFGWWVMLMKFPHAGGGIAPGDLRALWRVSSPLVLATLLSQSAVYVDGYLVQEFFPEDFVDFRYGAKEFPLVLLLANSMSIVRAGEIAAGRRDGNLETALRGLRASTNRLVWMLFPVSVTLLLSSEPLFALVFRDRFPHAVPVFDLFLLLAIPRLMFPQSVVRGFHKTYMMSVSAGVELALNVGLSLVLMQWWGMVGIAAGTVIAFLVEKLILLAYTQMKLGLGWNQYASIPVWLGWSLALVLVWGLKYVVGTV